MGLFGKSANDWNKIGLKQLDNGQYAQALIAFDKAIEKSNHDFWLWHNKAICLTHLRQFEQANACNEKALELNPNSIPSLINKTAILTIQQKYSESLLVSDELLKLNPDNIQSAIIWKNMAFAYDGMNQLDEAISCIDQAIKLDSNGLNGMYHEQKQIFLEKKNTPQVQDPQQNQESTFDGVLQESDITNNFSRLTWQNAEDLVGKLFEKKGYHSTVSQRTGDFGIDVEAKSDTEYIGIQVKHWSMDVGFEDVAKTLGVSSKFNKVIIVSTKSGFTSQAMLFARRDENRYRLELWNGQIFKQELRQHVIGK